MKSTKIILMCLLLCSLCVGVRAEVTLTLEQCLDSARVNNRTLKNAALEIQWGGERQKEAYTKYFPQISATATAFRAFDKIIKGDGTVPQDVAGLGQMIGGELGQQISALAGTPVTIREINSSYAVTLTAMEPIYAGGQIHKTNQLAAIQTDVCRLQLQMKEKDVLQKVTENYWHIAMVRYNLRTIAAAEKQVDEVLKHVQKYVAAGVTTSNAILQVKLRKQELESNKLKLENAEHVLTLLLGQQIGVPYVVLSIPDETAPTSMPLPADVLSSVNNREELQMASKGVEAQKLVVKKEWGKSMPTVAAGVMGYNLGIGGMSDMTKSYINNNMTNGLALATVSIPVSAWWSGAHAVRQQKIKLREAENTLLDARENLAIDIESAWSNLTQAYKQIGIAKTSVEQSEENLRMYTSQYKAGTVTINDLLDAETLNRKSHDQLSSAIADYNISFADYKRKTSLN